MNGKTEYIVVLPWELSPDEESPDEHAFMIHDGAGYEIAHDLAQGAAERIVACVNACKDIETKYLNEFPNWKLAVAHMARPGDVANLILKLGTYREALEKVVDQAQKGNFVDDHGHKLTTNTAYLGAVEALK